ncbi:MAG: hypothetical protein IRZ03_08870 [Acidobacterium ailaaui]|nr:hypothetical protein [Pseudacidobacterium ailaaui]
MTGSKINAYVDYYIQFLLHISLKNDMQVEGGEMKGMDIKTFLGNLLSPYYLDQPSYGTADKDVHRQHPDGQKPKSTNSHNQLKFTNSRLKKAIGFRNNGRKKRNIGRSDAIHLLYICLNSNDDFHLPHHS